MSRSTIRAVAPYGAFAICAVASIGLAAPVLLTMTAAGTVQGVGGILANVSTNLGSQHTNAIWDRACSRLCAIQVSDHPLMDAMSAALQEAITDLENDASPTRINWLGRKTRLSDAEAAKFYSVLRSEAKTTFSRAQSQEWRSQALKELNHGPQHSWDLATAYVEKAAEDIPGLGNHFVPLVKEKFCGKLMNAFHRQLRSDNQPGTAAWREFELYVYGLILDELQASQEISAVQHEELKQRLDTISTSVNQILKAWEQHVANQMSDISEQIALGEERVIGQILISQERVIGALQGQNIGHALSPPNSLLEDTAQSSGASLVVTDDLSYQPWSVFPPKSHWPNLTFDIGTIFALDRRRFIGVLTGEIPPNLWQNLARVERDLQHILSLPDSPPSIPSRKWIGHSTTIGHELPKSLEEFLSWCSAHPKSNLRDIFRTNGIIPGIILTLKTHPKVTSSEVAIKHILAWCHTIAMDFFPDVAMGLIINIHGPLHLDTLHLAEHICSRLQIDTLKLAEPPFTLVSASVAETDDLQLSPRPTSRPTGFTFYTPGSAVTKLMLCLLERWNDIPYGEQDRLLGPLIDWFNDLDDRTINSASTTSICASSITRDIINLFDKDIAPYGEHLLQLVRSMSPEHLKDIITAFAASDDEQLRRLSLSFASNQDVLLDAWVAGEARQQDSFNSDALLRLIRGRALAQPLFLGLVRWLRLGNTSPALKSAINALAEVLDYNFRLLSDFVLNPSPKSETALLRESGLLSRIELAIRGNALSPLLQQQLFEWDITSPHGWWLLSTFPPSPTFLQRLVGLSSDKRAIFGLCSPAEFAELERDSPLESLIASCRLSSLVFCGTEQFVA